MKFPAVLLALAVLLPAPAQAEESICYIQLPSGRVIDLTGFCADSMLPGAAQSPVGPTLKVGGLRIRPDDGALYLIGTVTNDSAYYATDFSLDYEIRTSGGRAAAQVTNAGIVGVVAFTPRVIPPRGTAEFKAYIGSDYGDVGAGRNALIVSGIWRLTNAAGETVDYGRQSFR